MTTRDTNDIADTTYGAGLAGAAVGDLDVKARAADPAHFIPEKLLPDQSHRASSKAARPDADGAIRTTHPEIAKDEWLPAAGRTYSFGSIRITAIAVSDAPGHPYFRIDRGS